MAAFVDYFKCGLVNKPVRVLSFGDFEREFGGLDAASEASYAIQQFFLNGGTEAWVVRSVGANARSARVMLLDGINGAPAFVLEAGRGPHENPGSWGNQLRALVEPLLDERFNLTILLVDNHNDREVVICREHFCNLTMVKG